MGTGAGHGAPGGSASSSSPGGVAYGLTRDPQEAGSGGGNSPHGQGGAGGGLLNLTVYYEIELEGLCDNCVFVIL